MSRLNLTETVMYLFIFTLVVNAVANLDIFNSWYPDQRWNSSTNSLEVYDRNTTSIFGTDNSTAANLTAKYSNVTIDPGAMINPVALVSLVGMYYGLFTDVLYTFSAGWRMILALFIGEEFAGILAIMLNVMILIAFLYVITGRTKVE